MKTFTPSVFYLSDALYWAT